MSYCKLFWGKRASPVMLPLKTFLEVQCCCALMQRLLTSLIIYPCIHPATYPFKYLFALPSLHAGTHLFIHACIQPCMYASIHPSLHALTSPMHVTTNSCMPLSVTSISPPRHHPYRPSPRRPKHGVTKRSMLPPTCPSIQTLT